ncbi:MAG: FkbM family methyltransferase [Chitinophagaceae bacterium]|nr:FkbM family methyltransferase [Chitinophagaceae bacterium]
MRKMIRNLLNKVGYDIVKVNVHSDKKAGRIYPVQVGNYRIDMPGNNPQISNYKYEPQVNSQLGRLTACLAQKYPDISVIDIGANVGDTIAVIKTHIEVPVIGIEGDDISYRFLEKNTRQFQQVSIIKEFLGEKKETVQVAFEKGGWNTTLVPSSTGQSLTLKTLDQVLTEHRMEQRRLKLLKIDCEGFDTIIIRGAGDLLRKQKPVLYFEYNKTNMEAIGEDGLSTLFALEQFGYRRAVFFDNKGRYFMSLPLSQRDIITQIHHYADETHSEIAYYDLCLFHEEDAELEARFVEQERDL